MDNNLTKIELENRYIKMYELYMEGKSYRELGVLFNISAERVRQVLHTRSSEDGLIELRRRIDNRCMNTWRSKEICNLLDAGNSCRRISELLNISIHAVKRVSAKYRKNVPVRLTPKLKST